MKNRFVTVMMAFMTLTGVYSCKEEKKENVKTVEMHEHHEGHKGETDHRDMAGSPVFKNEKFGEAYGHYIHIKTALVRSDAGEAQNGAKMLVKALGATENNGKGLEFATAIEKSDDIDVQRKAFYGLSEAFTTMIDGQIASGTVYKQFCPMAFDFEGAYWLSSEEEIRNPYFGDKMLTCGEIRERFN